MAVGVPPKAFAGDAGKEVPCRGENAARPPPLIAEPGCEEETDARPLLVLIAPGELFSTSK